jgi:hypothetical protein
MINSRFLRVETRLLPPPGDAMRLPVLTLLMFAPLVVGLIGVAMGQSVIWDLRNYHWYNAWAFLTGRYASGVDFAPSQLQFFHNPLIDLPFYWLATHAAPRAAFFALGCLQGLNFPLLFMLAHAVMKIRDATKKAVICLSLATLGVAGGMGISEFGTPFYDNVASLGVLGSALLTVARFDEIAKAPWHKAVMIALIAGIPVGIATGLKMTTAVFCVGLCAGYPLALRFSERGILAGFFFGLGILAGAALAYAHWGWYLQAHFGSPMFPYFNRIFKSPWVAQGYIEDFAAPQGLLVPLLYPFLFIADTARVSEAPFRDLRIPITYVLMVALGLFSLTRKRGKTEDGLAATYLLWSAAISYLVWISVEAHYRYLLPLEMLSPLLIVLSMERLPGLPRLKTAVTVALLLLIAVTVKPAAWERRAEWYPRMAEMTVPKIADPAHTMVLMAGEDAYAYLLPQFPPEVSFTRLESRAFHLDYGWRINDLIRLRIVAHKGPLKLFMPAGELKAGAQALGHFGLKLSGDKCQDITDNLPVNDSDPEFPKYYKLCDVTHPPEKTK